MNYSFPWSLLTIALYLDIQNCLRLIPPKMRQQKTGSNYTTQPVHVSASMMEGVGLVRKPVIQEVYVMENGTKVSK
jgi:hypothetical protein